MQLSFLSQKAQLFHELAQLVKSGTPMTKGLEIMSRGSNAIARTSRRIANGLAEKGSVSGAFQAAGFPCRRRGGHLRPASPPGGWRRSFLELERYNEELGKARLLIIKRSIYPLLMLHLAAVLLSIAPAILGTAGRHSGKAPSSCW